jgi:hypothetical protein
MTARTPYLHRPGTAREALAFDAEVFGLHWLIGFED